MPHTMYWQALHKLPPIQQDDVRVLWGMGMGGGDGGRGKGIDAGGGDETGGGRMG